MDRTKMAVEIELLEGKNLSERLKRLLLDSSDNQEATRALVEKILLTYDNAISLLKPAASSQDKVLAAGESESTVSQVSAHKPKGTCSRKRKSSSPRKEEMAVVKFASESEGPHNDLYSWRKYGQKDILGSRFPRGYYRCSHRFSHGCLATKQVQKLDDESTTLRIRYKGSHSCSHGTAETTNDHEIRNWKTFEGFSPFPAGNLERWNSGEDGVYTCGTSGETGWENLFRSDLLDPNFELDDPFCLELDFPADDTS